MTRLALIIVMAFATTAAAESDVTISWQGLRALGLSPEEQQVADDVIATSLHGSWFSAVDRNDTVAARCGSNVACHCDVARKREVRYAAYGTAGRLGDSWTVELTVIDAHACTVVAGSLISERLSREQSSARLREIAKHLAMPPEAMAATAVKGVRALDQTPAIVSTVTAAQLAATHMTTLDDVFASQPGFDVLDTNWGSIPLNQGLRNTLLIVVDGIPQINGMVNFRMSGRDGRYSLRNIDRIEMVRGPGSVVWGANAFLGVINLVTRDAVNRDGAVEAGIELGSSDSQELWVNGAQSRGAYSAVIGVDIGRRRGLSSMVRDSPYAVRGVPAGETAPWGNSGITAQAPDTWLDFGIKLKAGDWLAATFNNVTASTQFEISALGPLLDAGQGGFYDKTWRTYGLTATKTIGDVTLTAQASRLEFTSWESVPLQPRNPDASELDPEPYRDGMQSLQGNFNDPRVTHQSELRAAHVAGDTEGRGGWTNHLVGGIALLHLHTPTNYAAITPIGAEPMEMAIDFTAKDQTTISAFAVDEWSPVPWLVLSGGARARMMAPLEGSSWTPGLDLQGGAVIAGDGFGAKLIYAEGHRAPEANALFSTSGTKGNPFLLPERSRDLGVQMHLMLAPVLTASIGGNLTRLTNLLMLEATPDDPVFVNMNINGGETDVASGFVDFRLDSRVVDAVLRYGVTQLHESAPVAEGIPIAPHTIAGSVVVRPSRDLAMFVRSNVVSRRLVTAMVEGGSEPRRLPWGVRLAMGGTVSNILPGFDLELRVDNPFGFKRHVPYSVSGNPTFVEERSGTEAFATVRWNR